MLSSALLIHLSGGRIETHFHVFASMAFLAFYRDWRVLLIATVVVAIDHFLRGVYWAQSVFGIAVIEPYRWMEHAGWVILEDIFLWIMCQQSMAEMRQIAYRQAELELTNDIIETQVEERTHELKEKNQEILDSIHYAERIQKSMLESNQRVLYPGLNLFFIYRPRDIVSGDFIWVAQHDDTVFVAVVDCTGHGVPGAFMSLLGYNFLDHIVGYEKVIEPHLILSLLHTKIRERLNQTNQAGTNRDGMDVCLCALHTKTGVLHFSGARRPLYYTNSFGELQICKGDHYSIGGIQREEQRVFTTYPIPLESGQTFFLTTDGYVDQPSEENKKLGSQNLKIILKELAHEPFIEKKRRLEEALDRHQNRTPQRDDITLVGMEWSSA
jgi:serine phosphatase RsbU (regulator of sigma subunit)